MKYVITLIAALALLTSTSVDVWAMNVDSNEYGDLLEPSVSQNNIVADEKGLCGTIQAVDLALPSGTRWANMNVGATRPEDYGSYFQWGETTPTKDYDTDWDGNYTPGGNAFKGSQYNDCGTDADPMWADGTITRADGFWNCDIAGNPKYDAATANLGKPWKTPNIDQINELINPSNCVWTWTSQNGIYGYLITSVRNGNSIFLPAAGSFSSQGDFGSYWSSTLYLQGAGEAYTLSMDPSEYNCTFFIRCCDQSVRPVMEIDSNDEVDTISIRTMTGGQNIANSNSSVDGRSTDNNIDNVTGFPDGADFVDLDLPSGLCWANMNVGATKPEDAGDYFQWGSITPTLSNESPAFNEHYQPGGTAFQGQSDEECGTEKDPMFADGTIYLGPRDEWKGDIVGTKYDAATANWGTGWDMPNEAQIRELLDKSNCKWEWTTRNGVKGYKVISVRNGNSIFLPAAGCRSGETSVSSGVGYYWTSEIYPYMEAQYFGNYPSKAYALEFNSSYERIDLYQAHRCKAFCIRPVIFPAK